MGPKKRPKLTAKTIARAVEAMSRASIYFTVPGWFDLRDEQVLPFMRDPSQFYLNKGWSLEAVRDFLESAEPDEEHGYQLDIDPPKPKPSSYVYFIRNEKTGDIKVGCSADPWRRLCQLQTACPDELKLLDYHPGDQSLEAKLHILLTPYRLNGEWFKGDEMVYRVIDFMSEQQS